MSYYRRGSLIVDWHGWRYRYHEEPVAIAYLSYRGRRLTIWNWWRYLWGTLTQF